MSTESLYGTAATGTELTAMPITRVMCDAASESEYAAGWVMTSSGPLSLCQHHLNTFAATFAANGWPVSADLDDLTNAELAMTVVVPDTLVDIK